MEIQSLTDLGENLRRRCLEFKTKIQGPVTFDYGYGWSTSITFWADDRRVHFYFEGIQGTVYVLAEAAQIGPPRQVRMTRIQSTDEAWSVVARFLRNRCEFGDLPGHEWVAAEGSHDEHIPHPPEGEHPPVQPTKPEPKPTAEAPPRLAGKVFGIGAVMLYSNDAPKLAKWYQEVLGLALTQQDQRYYGTIAKIQFGIFPSETAIPAGQRSAMINYAVTNFDLFVAEVAGRGAELLGLDQNQFGKFAHFKDPDGNPVEIWGPP